MRENRSLKHDFNGMVKYNKYKRRMKLRDRANKNMMKKIISVFTLIVLAISMTIVNMVPVLEAADVANLAKFTNVVLEVNGVEVDVNTQEPLDQDSVVTIKYDFEVTDGGAINVGDTIKTTVPAGFLIANDVSGDVAADNSVIGEFTLNMNTRELKITFNANVTNSQIWTGQVVINSRFELDEIPGDDNPVTIEFAINDNLDKSVVLKFTPNNVASAIEKYGAADKASNPTKIDWIVEVNKQLEVVNAVVVEDDFEEGLALDENSIKVYKLDVDLAGNSSINGGALILNNDYTITYDAGTRELDVNIGDITTGYRIEYSTDITDITKTDFNNTASFSGGSSEATVSISRGSLIEKVGVADREFNPTEITWTIEVNKYEGELVDGEIIDTLPVGLTYKANTARLYKIPLNADGSVDEGNVVDLGDVSGSYDNAARSFNVEIGNNDDAYRLVFITTIDDYGADSIYTNRADLHSNDISIANDSDVVITNYGTWIEKTSEAHIDYDSKKINWSIYTNTIEKVIEGGMIADIIPADITIDMGSVVLEKLSFNPDGSIASEDNLTVGDAKAYDAGTRTFTIDLNKIVANNAGINSFDFALRIRFRTDIDDVDVTGPFVNTATLTSTNGAGNGESSSRTQPVYIKNYMLKDYVNGSLNYADKTMKWRIYVRPVKEEMQDLVVTDTFPNGGLSFIENTLVIKKGGNVVDPANYVLTITDNDSTKGFVVTFNNGIVKDTEFTIEYTTDFDRDWHTNVNEPRTYENAASAEWTEVVGNKVDTDDDSVEISTTARDNGNKSGVLRRIDKEIDWTVNINYLSEEFTDYIVVDTIPNDETDNHEVLVDSIKVYDYTVQADGSMVKGDEIVEGVGDGKFTIVSESLTGFTIKLNGTINSPYRIEYTTKLVNDTISEYNNSATFDGKTVSASVNFDDSDQFVSKNNPPSGISLDWEVAVNTSLSMIEDATLTDIIGYGHEYDKDSLQVSKVINGGEEVIDASNYTATYEILNAGTGEQKFTLVFNNTIEDEYIIRYTTKVYVTSDTTVSNNASFTGNGVEVHNDTTNKEVAIAVTAGYSLALATRNETESKGDLNIIKVDGNDNTILLEDAVYNLLDANKDIVATLGATDANGETTVIRLERAIYYLVETVAPTDYVLPRQNLVEVDMTAGEDVEVTLPNYKWRPNPNPGGDDPEEEVPEEPEEEVEVEVPEDPEREEKVTDEDEPIDGEVDIPDDSVAEAGQEPENGEVTVDEEGGWTYTPDPGFIGKDSFSIIIKNLDDEEEEIFIDIIVEELPEGIIELPKTAGVPSGIYSSLGLLLAGLGLLLKKRKMDT